MQFVIDSTWELVGHDNPCILFYSILFYFRVFSYSIPGNEKRYEKGFSSIDSHLRGDRHKSTNFYYLKYLLWGVANRFSQPHLPPPST